MADPLPAAVHTFGYRAFCDFTCPCLVQAVEQTGRMRGGSQPHLMRCSDGNYYVVKFRNNPQHRRVLVNELLGTRLAALLGLPTLPFALVDVSRELICWTSDLAMEMPWGRVPCEPGVHFGSRYAGDPRRGRVDLEVPDYRLGEVENLRDFLGMLVFDQWTCNTDTRQVVFPEGSSSTLMVRMIDQGCCFNGDRWTFPDRPLWGLYPQRLVYRSVRSLDDFEPWLTRLDKLGVEDIQECAKNIPSAWWRFDRYALLRLLDQLNHRRARIRELLIAVRNSAQQPFPNWMTRVRSASAQGEKRLELRLKLHG